MKRLNTNFFLGMIVLNLVSIVLSLSLGLTKIADKIDSISVPQPSAEMTVLHVVGEAHTNYDSMGSGSSGLILLDGHEMVFVPFHKLNLNSRVAPTTLLRQEIGDGQYYYPLYEAVGRGL